MTHGLSPSIARRPSRPVKVGGVTIGGGRPIVVQSMTNTNTADVKATTAQVAELAAAGSELVRITVNNADAAQATPRIRERLDKMGLNVPIVGDFHFIGYKLLKENPACAEALAKYRINPGNVGRGGKGDRNFSGMVEIALKYNKPIRIGVNWGSLDQELLARLMDENAQLAEPWDAGKVTRQALVLSATESAKRAEDLGMDRKSIVLSCKVSNAQDLISVYRDLASRGDWALHLGLTEAGMGSKGIVASAASMGVLLQEGIGDTIRVSLTPEPGGSRSQEVAVAQELLQVMSLRAFTPMVTACPGCGRTTNTFFQELAKTIQSYVRDGMIRWREEYIGVEEMTLAVMGCVVNGPGESKRANIGISLPGSGEDPVAPVYIDGKKAMTLKGHGIAEDFQRIIDTYVATHYERRT